MRTYSTQNQILIIYIGKLIIYIHMYIIKGNHTKIEQIAIYFHCLFAREHIE